MFSIVKAPDLVLSAQAKPVANIDKEIISIIEGMKETLAATKDPEGVGLAAPQVGKSLRIFIAKPLPKSEVMICINPVILSKSEAMVPLKRPASRQGGPKKSKNKKAGALEGCLSLDNVWGTVLRAPSLVFEYMDEHGKKHKKSCKGFLATIVQHETDHLNGILFPRRVLEQKGKLYKQVKNEKGENVFEPLEI